MRFKIPWGNYKNKQFFDEMANIKRTKFQNMVEKSRPQKKAITKIRNKKHEFLRKGRGKYRNVYAYISKLAKDHILRIITHIS